MRGLTTTLKKIFFWNYPRNTWQWDLLCVVILIFIFLTPKKWFTSGELPLTNGHQSPIAEKVFLSREVVDNQADTGNIEQRVREQTGRKDVAVVAVKQLFDADGKFRGFEVDIR